MEVIELAKQIDFLIKELRDEISKIEKLSEKKARTEAIYDRDLSLTIIRLNNGSLFEYEGEKIKMSATNADKEARGICWKQKEEMLLADGLYKALHTRIRAIETQISALQSKNKYLDKN